VSATAAPLRDAQRSPSRGWLLRPRPNPHAALRLFCFAYAGGSAQIFACWPGGLPREVDVAAVQLPGHGLRLLERPIARMDDLAAGIASGLRPHLDRPFAFFGHSMGALVAFELARQLRREGLPAPVRMYVSAHNAPQLPREPSAIHELPDDEFHDAVAGYGATPADVLADAEMMRLLAPALRADFAVCEKSEYVREEPFDFPIRAFWGLADSVVSRDTVEAWRDQTTSNFAARAIPGSHFYIHSAERLLLQLLARDLAEELESEGGGQWSPA
jgi:medium-chain acyl-[acyl-carrier-protein] hydrolase